MASTGQCRVLLMAPKTFDAIKKQLAHGPKVFGKTDLTPPRTSISVPREMSNPRPESKPQFRNDQALPGTSGDVSARSWLRGGVDATKGPNFDASPQRGKERR